MAPNSCILSVEWNGHFKQLAIESENGEINMEDFFESALGIINSWKKEMANGAL